MSENKRKELIACFGLLVTALIWGVAFVAVKSSLDYMPALYVIAMRFTVGALVLAIVFAPRFKNLTPKIVLHSAGIGLILFLAYAFQTYGCALTTAGKNAFLTTVYMILVPFVNFFVVKIKPEIKSVIAAVIGFVGIGFISLNGDFSIQLGDFLTLICGLFFAVQIVFIAKYTQTEDPILITIGQLFFTALYAWIVAPFADGPVSAGMINKTVIFGIIYLGIMSTAIANLLQNISQKYAPPGPAAILMSMESVFGALAGVILLKEHMSGAMITGCILMFIAIIMSELSVIPMFYPDEFIDSTYNIDFKKLYEEGIRGVIFDIDNTLVEHGAPADARSIVLLRELEEMGLKVMFISNNKEPRVKSFRDATLPNAGYVYKAGKPKKSGYLKAMEVMGTSADNTVFVGDQLFTDVYGARRCSIKSILVGQIDKHEEIQIVLKRKLEWIVLRSYKKSDAYRNSIQHKK